MNAKRARKDTELHFKTRIKNKISLHFGGQHYTRNIFQKDYDEVAEDIFDMSNVRGFKEIEKKKKRMFILCYVFG